MAVRQIRSAVNSPKGDAQPLDLQGSMIFRSSDLIPDYDFILNADAKDGLMALKPSLVDCIVTSPPYFGQRDYGVEGQLGCESNLNDYIDRLVKIFREAKNVLKDEGTLWLNLGDKYLGKQLMGAPWRVALALQEDGWYLRSDIIWHKPNAMPSPGRDRPTVDHEYMFLLSKSADYLYDSDAVREPHVTFTEKSRMRGGRGHLAPGGRTPENGKNGGLNNLHTGVWDSAFHPNGRNRRTVWEVPLSKFRGAHFAVFPEKLIEPCILAGSRIGGVVLDPFFGSGTSGVVAGRLGRRFVGIEISREYCEMASKRLLGLPQRVD